MDDEDSIDLEALQAQIDMSMAFAENMVSSWVKPSRKLSSKSNRDLEAELKEYMCRPPRLGVGAAIPESANSSRDTARLKDQLVGKGNKRPRKDESNSRGKDDTDSDGETRGGVIKKKGRVDPFTKDGKKKKKHKMTPENALLKRQSMAQEEVEGLEESVNIVTQGVVPPSSPFATSKGEKYENDHPTVEPSHDTVQTPVSSVVLVNTSPSTPLNKQPERLTTRSTERKVVEPSVPAISLKLQRQAQTAALLKFPLLNLSTVHDDSSDHEDEGKSDVRESSPKKKRKRKKRKKKGDASASTVLETPAFLS